MSIRALCLRRKLSKVINQQPVGIASFGSKADLGILSGLFQVDTPRRNGRLEGGNDQPL